MVLGVLGVLESWSPVTVHGPGLLRLPGLPKPSILVVLGFGSPGSLEVLESSYSSWSRTLKTPNIPNFDDIGNPVVKTPETPKALQIGGFGSLDFGIANIIKIWDIGSLGSPGP